MNFPVFDKNRENDSFREHFRETFRIACSIVLCFKQNTEFCENFTINLLSEYSYLYKYLNYKQFEKEILRLAIFLISRDKTNCEIHCKSLYIKLRNCFSVIESAFILLKYKYSKKNTYIRFVLDANAKEFRKLKKSTSKKIEQVRASFLL